MLIVLSRWNFVMKTVKKFVHPLEHLCAPQRVHVPLFENRCSKLALVGAHINIWRPHPKGLLLRARWGLIGNNFNQFTSYRTLQLKRFAVVAWWRIEASHSREEGRRRETAESTGRINPRPAKFAGTFNLWRTLWNLWLLKLCMPVEVLSE